jgi:hypothetical protein
MIRRDIVHAWQAKSTAFPAGLTLEADRATPEPGVSAPVFTGGGAPEGFDPTPRRAHKSNA